MLTMSFRTRVLLTVTATSVLSASLRAQVTEIARTPIADGAQLTFGYLCDDRFVIRNDGTNPVDLEYAVAKSNTLTKLTINARETVELASPSKEAMELWLDGKLVAKALKEKRACKDVQGNANVAIAPLEVTSNERDRRVSAFGSPFFDPWMYGFYGSLGYRPYYSSFYNPGFYRAPIIIAYRGGGRRGR